jgi:hypothetical protein
MCEEGKVGEEKPVLKGEFLGKRAPLLRLCKGLPLNPLLFPTRGKLYLCRKLQLWVPGLHLLSVCSCTAQTTWPSSNSSSVEWRQESS